jgi:5'-3' exonuclease-like protein
VIILQVIGSVRLKTAIIDGDVLCYHSCPPRWDPSKPIPLDVDGNRVYPTFTPEQDRKYLETSWNILLKNIEELVDKLFCDDFVMAVGGNGNFRKDIFSDYKISSSRQTKGKPPNVIVPALRELLVFEGHAIAADGCEADDLIRTWALQARAADEEYVICSIDKDLKCIPGWHYFMHKGKEQLVEISEWEAKVFFYQQLLQGDPVDSIPGIPGIGPVKAEKQLAECTTEEELQEKVVELYFAFYQEEWYDYLLANGRLLYLMSQPEDFFSIEDWSIVKELR